MYYTGVQNPFILVYTVKSKTPLLTFPRAWFIEYPLVSKWRWARVECIQRIREAVREFSDFFFLSCEHMEIRKVESDTRRERTRWTNKSTRRKKRVWIATEFPRIGLAGIGKNIQTFRSRFKLGSGKLFHATKYDNGVSLHIRNLWNLWKHHVKLHWSYYFLCVVRRRSYIYIYIYIYIYWELTKR